MQFFGLYFLGGLALIGAIGSIAQGLNRIAAAIEGLQKANDNSAATKDN